MLNQSWSSVYTWPQSTHLQTAFINSTLSHDFSDSWSFQGNLYYRGFWQQRGWDDEAVIKTMSRIDTVKSYTAVNAEPLLLGGIAFAGARGVTRVEYSVDGGQTWQDAEIKPPLGPLTWVLWAVDWTPPGPGQYTIKVRATDKTGVVQSALVADPLPDGAAGLHAVTLRTLAG